MKNVLSSLHTEIEMKSILYAGVHSLKDNISEMSIGGGRKDCGRRNTMGRLPAFTSNSGEFPAAQAMMRGGGVVCTDCAEYTCRIVSSSCEKQWKAVEQSSVSVTSAYFQRLNQRSAAMGAAAPAITADSEALPAASNNGARRRCDGGIRQAGGPSIW